MANTKINADGNSMTVWLGLPNAFANWEKPTVAELNATQNLTAGIAWDGWSFGAQASTQNSDPSMIDVGNVQTKGFAQFGGDISFFYPFDYTDTSNELLSIFLALQVPGTFAYLVTRADGLKTTAGAPDSGKVAVTNDLVNIYYVQSDGWNDNVTGELAFKYVISFIAQGNVDTNVLVATTVTVTTPAAIGTPDYTVGGKTPLGSYANRQLHAETNIWNGTPGWLAWTSEDPSIASVDTNGVVTGVSVGGPVDIIATHKPTGTPSTGLAVTIS